MSRIRSTFRSLLELGDTPERTALAFALGVFLGFSPLLGLHTILALLLSFLFRLNRLAVLSGVYSNAPLFLVPFYGFATWLGLRVTGMEGINFPEVGFSDLFSRHFWIWVAGQGRLLIPAFVGSSILCTAMALLSYPAALYVIRKYRRNGAP